MKLSVTRGQLAFIQSAADETLFGGAAGGGKSYAQLIDALVFALRYPRSHQLLLRRTLPELERSLIRVSLGLYPRTVGQYLISGHRWRFVNGSELEFGSCDAETDVIRYQSAEYDVLRFDELTHFTAYQFTYLLSRVRGANDYPKLVKSTTNPGGVGHDWVKRRYIDCLRPGEPAEMDGVSRLFLPARAQDNVFLMRRDKGYLKRLALLPENDRRALLEGEWTLSEGRYFTEFDRALHVCAPYPLPAGWPRYLSIDYGLDMLAALWIAVSPAGRCVVYRELYESGLILSEAARRILACELPHEQIVCRYAPPDLWGRRQESGRSAIDLMAAEGLYFDRSDNRRASGWWAVKEYLRPCTDETGAHTARMQIFSTCSNLIRTLPALQISRRDPNDVATTPHELTHAPDALRGFCATVGDVPGRPNEQGWEDEVRHFLAYRPAP